MWVRSSDVKAGDYLEADGGFDCVQAGRVLIEEDERGELFFRCRAGMHFLDGQEDEEGSLVGLTKPA